MMQPVLIHHAANRGKGFASGSLAGLKDCVQSGVTWVEVDLIPLADGDFALLHDVDLEAVTNGQGKVNEKKAVEIQQYSYRTPSGTLSAERVGTLSQLVSWLKDVDSPTQIQLDLKPYAPLSEPVLLALLSHLESVLDRVLVSSVADWAVRTLHRLEPALRLGFDPLLYLDLPSDSPRPQGVPPLRIGAYGVLDDHPLSIQRWGSDRDYFAARAEALFHQVPQGVVWYLHAGLLKKTIDAGFDWIGFLHENGSQVAAWTLDAAQIDLVSELMKQGINLITTNQTAQLKQTLGDQVRV